MPELQDISDNAVPAHLQEYFAGITSRPVVGKPPREPLHADEPAPLVFHESELPQDVDELTLLRRQLAEKDHAIFRAVLSAQDLQQQLELEKAEALQLRTELASVTQASGPQQETVLPANALPAEAQAELDKQKREWFRIQKSLEREHNARKAELVKVRGQWYQTQQQLESESRARRMEHAQASAKISRLEQELTTTTTTLAAERAGTGHSGAKRFVTLAGVCAALCLVAALGWNWHTAQASSPAPQPIVTATNTTPGTTNTPQTVRAPIVVPPASIMNQGNFQGALSKLNRELSSFGNRPPEDVMAEVRRRSGDPSLCAFRWNGGQPALLYGTSGMKEHLGQALDRCAVAVKQLK